MPDFKIPFPAFKPEEEDDARLLRKVIAYLKVMHEQLTYLFNNLDADNLGASLTGTIDGKADTAALDETDKALDETVKQLLWTGPRTQDIGEQEIWTGLAGFVAAISGRQLTERVRANLTSDVSGDATHSTVIDSLTGKGRLTIDGGGHTLDSGLTLTNNYAPVIIKNMTINGAVQASNSRFIRFENVTFRGVALINRVLYLEEGTTCDLVNCTLSGATSLIEAHEGVILTTHNIRGSANNFLNGSHMIAMMSGTRPQGAAALTACLTSPANLESLTPSGG